mgnify:FL=1
MNVVQDVGTTDEVVGVTYGSLALTEVAGSPNIHATGEPSVVYTFTSLSGDTIPTGAQTVAVDVDATGSLKIGVSFTLTAAAAVEIVDVDATIDSDSQDNPSVTLSLSGRTSFCCIAFHSGQNILSAITPLTGWTARTEYDFGTKTAGFYTYNTIAGTDVTAGWTQAAEDACAIALAMSEVVASGGEVLTAAPVRRLAAFVRRAVKMTQEDLSDVAPAAPDGGEQTAARAPLRFAAPTDRSAVYGDGTDIAAPAPDGGEQVSARSPLRIAAPSDRITVYGDGSDLDAEAMFARLTRPGAMPTRRQGFTATPLEDQPPSTEEGGEEKLASGRPYRHRVRSASGATQPLEDTAPPPTEAGAEEVVTSRHPYRPIVRTRAQMPRLPEGEDVAAPDTEWMLGLALAPSRHIEPTRRRPVLARWAEGPSDQDFDTWAVPVALRARPLVRRAKPTAAFEVPEPTLDDLPWIAGARILRLSTAQMQRLVRHGALAVLDEEVVAPAAEGGEALVGLRPARAVRVRLRMGATQELVTLDATLLQTFETAIPVDPTQYTVGIPDLPLVVVVPYSATVKRTKVPGD